MAVNYKNIFHKTYEMYIKSKSEEDKQKYEQAKKNYEIFLEIRRILENKNDFYKVLNVMKNAESSDIIAAYRSLAKRIHPNACKIEQCEEAFKIINEAKQVLSNEETRNTYDGKGDPFSNMVFRSNFSPAHFSTVDISEIFSSYNFEEMDRFLTPEDIFRMTMSRMRRPNRRAQPAEREDNGIGNFLRLLIIFLIFIKIIALFF